MSEGFIAMHREAFEHHLLRDAERFRAWFWLVSEAAWKPTRVRIKGETIELQRGELSFAQRFLAEKWGWSKSRVDRFIADLRDEGMIETRTKNGASAGHKAGQGQAIISICNYAKYQDVAGQERGNDEPQERGNIGASAGQARGEEEPLNKLTIKKEEEPPTPLAAGGDDTTQPKAKRKPRVSADPMPQIPDWMPVEAWNGYLAMRIGKGARPTPHAVTLLIEKLDGFRRSGHDPTAILNYSTINNYTGIFEPKAPQNDRSPPNFSRSAKPRSVDGAIGACDRLLAETSRPSPVWAGIDAG